MPYTWCIQLTRNSLIAGVVNSCSCILFIFAVSICHVGQFHCSDLHVLPTLPIGKPYMAVHHANRWTISSERQVHYMAATSCSQRYRLRSYLRTTRSTTKMQAAASTSTITNTATPASRPGSGDGLGPGSTDVRGLVPGSVDGVGPEPVNGHVNSSDAE